MRLSVSVAYIFSPLLTLFCCCFGGREWFPCGSAGKESAYNPGDLGSIPGSGRSPGEGKGCPLQYSGLENPMGYMVYRVPKSPTGLSNFHFHFTFF